MKKELHKLVLSEISLYYGKVDMPEGWEIDRNFISHEILQSKLNNKNIHTSRTFDKLESYIREYIYLRHKISLRLKKFWGNIYSPLEHSSPLKDVDPVDLRNSPDFTMLYGVNVEDCIIKIHYDDNRRANRTWEIPLINNKFVMFPSSCMYRVLNNQKENLNFILTTTHEFV